MVQVGVRELKQNASQVLRLVQAGATVQITDRGRPVAQLVPIQAGSRLDQLIAEGRVRPAEGRFNEFLRDVPALRSPAGQPRPSEILAEMRADER
ncbi:MAG: type II toxin-antitoxin system Phd/YefM family antitoxin [Chloroflexota bacterium]